MSLIWADNFSIYGLGGDAVAGSATSYALDGPYAQIGRSGFIAGIGGCAFVPDPDPTAGGRAVIRFIPQAGAAYEEYVMQLRKNLPTPQTTIGGFARLQLAQLPSNAFNGPMVRFADNNNFANLYFQVTPIGTIKVFRGAFDTAQVTLGETASCITAGTWQHIEWKVTFNNTEGSVEIWVDGRQRLELEGVDTVANSVNCQAISLGMIARSSGDSCTSYWKDFVIWDTGGTGDNDFFGPCEVGYFRAIGDVDFNWQASTGTTGYNLIDEIPPADADYIFADVTDTDSSEFELPDLDPEVTSVRGMMLIGRCSKSDGGDCDVQLGVKSNGDAAIGTNHPVATDFTYYTDIIENNPDTGNHFTPIEFNAATITVDRIL